jgi:prepilin-type N-terminal cleavage/methylation domain-containing protein
LQEAGTLKLAGRERGFTLVETLVALTILAIALFLGMALLLQQPRVLHRLDAERQALRAIESTVESLRAGLLPLEDAEYDGFNTAVGGTASGDLTLAVTVESTTTVALYKVHVAAHYLEAGHSHTREIDTLIWRP